MEPFGISLFCEDIREEVGGKKSLMGVFDADLVVSHFPIVIPKLAVLIRLIVPGDLAAGALTWKVYFPGDQSDAPAFKVEESITESESRGSREPSADWRDGDVTPVQEFNQSAIFSPVRIKHEGLIKVRVDVGDITVKAGVLRVHAPREGR